VVGDGDGPRVVVLDPVHGLVVDEELASVVTSQGDVFVLGGQDDVDDLAVAAAFIELNAHHDRSFVADPSAHGGSLPGAGGGEPGQGIDVLSGRLVRCVVSGAWKI
jgi:hypothetical protein